MIQKRLADVILRELKLDAFPFEESTKATEVPGWDSLKHASILAAIEDEYGIRFRGLETMRLRDVGELQKLVDRKLSAGK